MIFESTTKWLDLLINCFRADLINWKSKTEPETEEQLDFNFEINFEGYRDAIVYMVNVYILIDETEFEILFDLFKEEIRANFASSDTDQRKQSFVDDVIYPRLTVIDKSRNRLGRTLLKVWGSEGNKVFSYSKVWRYEFIELALNSTREGQLERNYNYAKNEQDKIVAKGKLDLFLLNRQPKESQLYLLIKAALLTDEFLKSYLEVWKPSSTTNRVLITPFVKSVSSGNEPNNLGKPVINKDIQDDLYAVLKPYFALDQQPSLKQRLMGVEDGNGKLLFMDSGNKLADVFLQMLDSNLITGCQRNNVEEWLERNFQYLYRNKIKDFTTSYLNGIISTKGNQCQSPIVSIEKIEGKFVIEPVERERKIRNS